MKKQFVKAVINDRTYTIDRNADYDGWIDSPKDDTIFNLVVFGGMKNTRKCLDTFIHECLHACDESASEKLVIQVAAAAAKELWFSGLRYSEACRRGRPSILPCNTLLWVLLQSGWNKLIVGQTATDIANALIKVGYRLK